MTTKLVPVKGTSKVDKVTAEEREKALAQMNDNLRAVHEEAEDLLNRETECIIRSRYELGLLVKEVDEDEKNSYGAKAIETLSKALGRNKTILYDALKFVNTYSEEQVNELLAARNNNNIPLSWSHVEALIHTPDDDVRDKMLDSALIECWTGAELAKKISEALGGTRSNSPGRPLSKPKSFDGYLDSIITTSEVLTKKVEQVWLGGDKTLIDAANEIEDVSDKTLAKLQDALDKMADTVYAATQTAKELTLLQRKLVKERVTTATDEEEATDDVTEDEEEELPPPPPPPPVKKKGGRPKKMPTAS